MSDKTMVDFPQLVELAHLAVANDTEDAFIPVALQWAEAADTEINRLRNILDRIVMGKPGDVHIYFDRDAMNAAKEYMESK